MDMVEDRYLAQYSITKTTTPLCHSAELFNRFPHQSARRRAESLTEYLLEHIPAVVFRGVVCAAFLTLAPNTLIVSNNLLRSAGSSFESETKITGEIFFWWGVRLCIICGCVIVRTPDVTRSSNFCVVVHSCRRPFPPAGIVPLVLADEVPHVPAPVIVVHAQVHVGPGLHLAPPVLDGGEGHHHEEGSPLALRVAEHVVKRGHHLFVLFCVIMMWFTCRGSLAGTRGREGNRTKRPHLPLSSGAFFFPSTSC